MAPIVHDLFSCDAHRGHRLRPSSTNKGLCTRVWYHHDSCTFSGYCASDTSWRRRLGASSRPCRASRRRPPPRRRPLRMEGTPRARRWRPLLSAPHMLHGPGSAMTPGSDDVAPSTWPPARVELLRLHHALGLSALVSARLIGGVSRNAVISKRRRLGLVGANPLQAMMRALGRASRAACGFSMSWGPGRVVRHPLERPGAARSSEPLPFMDWPAPPDARPSTLADREVGECAWPLGPAEEPGDHRTSFCCAPAKRGRPYCATHAERARRPAASPPPASGKGVLC